MRRSSTMVAIPSYRSGFSDDSGGALFHYSSSDVAIPSYRSGLFRLPPLQRLDSTPVASPKFASTPAELDRYKTWSILLPFLPAEPARFFLPPRCAAPGASSLGRRARAPRDPGSPGRVVTGNAVPPPEIGPRHKNFWLFPRFARLLGFCRLSSRKKVQRGPFREPESRRGQ